MAVDYKSARGKIIILVNAFHLLLFLRNTQERDFSLKDPDDEQRK